MGRKLHGREKKKRYTLTLDGELVARALELGKSRKIHGLSGAIEYLARAGLSSDVTCIETQLSVRTAMVELFVATRMLLQTSGIPFSEYPACGSYKVDFKVAGVFVLIGSSELCSVKACRMLAEHRRGKYIAIVASSEIAKYDGIRVMNLVKFAAWLNTKGKG